MRSRPPGDGADKQAGVRVAFDDHVEGSHAPRITRRSASVPAPCWTLSDGLGLSSQPGRGTGGGTLGGTPPRREVFPLYRIYYLLETLGRLGRVRP
jgi:hypothetical protein